MCYNGLVFKNNDGKKKRSIVEIIAPILISLTKFATASIIEVCTNGIKRIKKL